MSQKPQKVSAKSQEINEWYYKRNISFLPYLQQQFNKGWERLLDNSLSRDLRRFFLKSWKHSHIRRGLVKLYEFRFLTVVLIVLFIAWIGFWIQREEGKPWYKTIFENLESIALASAGIIFILEVKDRQKRDHYEAWQVINSAQGQRGSGGRIQALQDLNKDGVHLEGISAPRADLSKINLRGAKLARANLRRAQLDYANLQKANLKNANLKKAFLNHVHLEEANLQYANLKGAKLSFAHLEGADLRDAHLEGANLSFAHLEGADLRGAHLEGANLTEARLEGAILENTHLEKAKLIFAHLERASLEQAELEEASLFGAFFDKETHLLNANFRKADLENAEGLTSAHLTDVLLCETTMPDGTKDSRDCIYFEDDMNPQ